MGPLILLIQGHQPQPSRHSADPTQPMHIPLQHVCSTLGCHVLEIPASHASKSSPPSGCAQQLAAISPPACAHLRLRLCQNVCSTHRPASSFLAELLAWLGPRSGLCSHAISPARCLVPRVERRTCTWLTAGGAEDMSCVSRTMLR